MSLDGPRAGMASPSGCSGCSGRRAASRGVIAASTASSGKREVRARRHVHDAAAGRLHARRVHVEGRLRRRPPRPPRSPALRHAAAAAQMPSSRPLVSTTQRGIDAERAARTPSSPRRSPDRPPSCSASMRPDRLEHLRRAAGGVLVQVQPQRAVDTGLWLVARLSCLVMPIIDSASSSPDRSTSHRPRVRPRAPRRAPASSPSARGARAPSADSCCTAITRTKSAALRPPRKRAAPAVGST